MSRDLILVAISMITWGVGEGMFLYFQPIYLQQLGADPLSIGTILGGFGLMMTISHVPAGYLADRLGRKPIMLAAWVMGVVATWIMALANSLPFFVAGLLLYGVTLFVISPLNSYITAARGRFSVGRAITLISASFNLGVVIGPWLGGQIGEQMGLRQTYYIAAWLFMASTIIIFLIRSQPVETASMGEAGNGWMFNSRYLAYFAIVFLAMFATYLPQPLSPNFLQNQRALSLSQIGRLYSVSSIGVVALNLTLGQLPARAGFILGQVSVGLFAVLLWRGSGLPLYTLGYFMLGGYKTARSLAAAQMRELVHQAKMGLAYGLTETVSSTATMLSPPLAGYLYNQNPIWIYPLAVGLILISILMGSRFLPLFGEGKIELAPTRISTADAITAASVENYETPEQ
jgi:MFS family permease